jgi:murein L,D-transpeptidase YafK
MSKPGGKRLVGLGLVSALLAASPASAEPPASDPSAAERLARWRAVKNGQLRMPLPGTPDTDKPLTRLAAIGVSLGAPMMIRIFKAESELEVWVKKRTAYVHFATYPICYWSGTLGPKLREGDRQAPEGFYAMTDEHLHHGGRWPRSLNIGYPNVFDRGNGRSGSAILVHGGCDSIGCFAMTDAVNAELYDLVSASLRRGTDHVPVHVFPFRMTHANLATYRAGRWKAFWDDLKLAYDSFERTRQPPSISVCGGRYRVRDASPFMRNATGIELCEQDRDRVPAHLDPQEQAEIAPPARLKRPEPACTMKRASCRKWVALRDRRAASRSVATHNGSAKRTQMR